MVSDRALWQAINAHNLDAADAALPFSRRLMRETGWTHAFAKRAIHEYKAFIYLVCTAGTVLTPSDAVDQVWHLHLLYTRDYWDRFCAEVLQRRIHHGPTEGGAAEDARYREAYDRTRSLYRAEFGAPPPAELWPDAGIRQPAKTPANASDYFHLPKRQVFLCLGGAGLALLAGCAPETVTTLWRTHHLTAIGGLALAWWLFVTFSQLGAIRRRGLTGYLLGSLGVVPFVTIVIYAILMALGHVMRGHWDGDYTWLLAFIIAMAWWRGAYLTPRRKGGGGSGCGSGCGGGPDGTSGHGHGGHGSGDGHGGGGHDSGGHSCGGHSCGSGCGGGH